MLVTVTSQDLINDFDNYCTNRKVGHFTGTYGVIDWDHNGAVFRLMNSPRTRSALVLTGDTMSAQEAAEEASVIASLGSSLTTGDMRAGTYSDIKNDPIWQHMYHYASRGLDFLTSSPGSGALTPVRKQHPTYPCHYCGIVLPMEFVEVDHRQPESKPRPCVIKSLRAVNPLNVSAIGFRPGTKASACRNIANVHLNNFSTANIPKVAINGWDFATPFTEHGETDDRYTLSNRGLILDTLLQMFWGETKYQTYCIYSILNLVPACRACNGTNLSTGKGAKINAKKTSGSNHGTVGGWGCVVS